MSLPKTLKICGLTYTVTEKEHGEMAEVNYTNQEIRIRPGNPSDCKEDSLLHEIVHICCQRSGLTQRMRDKDARISEEEFVCCVVPLLYHSLKDNGLLAFPKERK